jgi:uncharacterized membrane protein YciS (DUF1049 family)
MSETNACSSSRPQGLRAQFSLSTLFSLLFALGLYLAYLRRHDTAVVLYGCLAIGMGLVIGGAAGCVGRRLADAMYWAALSAALGYIATVDERAWDVGFRLAWAAVGAMAGAGGNLFRDRRPVWSLLCAGVGSALAMATYLLIADGTLRVNLFDAICAPIIGFLIGVLILIMDYLEATRRLPRFSVASWLLCAVLAGNLAVSVFIRQGH